MSDKNQLTISVPEAGRRYFNLSRGGSYEAAKRGEIPTIRIGRLIRVPVRALERMLDKAVERSRGIGGSCLMAQTHGPSRPTAPKPTLQTQRRPGRPRKAERDNTHSASA